MLRIFLCYGFSLQNCLLQFFNFFFNSSIVLVLFEFLRVVDGKSRTERAEERYLWMKCQKIMIIPVLKKNLGNFLSSGKKVRRNFKKTGKLKINPEKILENFLSIRII